MGGTLARRPAADRWVRTAGILLAWAAVAAALAGTLHHPAGPLAGAVALAVTLFACAVLVAWATSPPVPLSRGERGWRAASGAGHAPLTSAIARPAVTAVPLAAPPRPLYATDDLARSSSVSGETRSPFLDDALFRLEPPGPGARLLRVSKDSTQLCQDSFACDVARRVYAVTDGVSRSFMPATWARIVAQAAVAHPEPFDSEAEFAAWLDAAADRWRTWMRDVWLPRAAPGEWSAAIDGQGAQTTLVCCSIGKPPAGADTGQTRSIRVDVTAIGDAECLLFRPAAGRWELNAAFPLEHPADFGASPATLSTHSEPALSAAMYRSLRRASFDARPGDRLALATDAVASWLLAQARAQGSSVSSSVASVSSVVDSSPSPRPPRTSATSAFPVTSSSAWGENPIALVLDDPAVFERLAQAEIDAGRLEDDDFTLLVTAIP